LPARHRDHCRHHHRNVLEFDGLTVSRLRSFAALRAGNTPSLVSVLASTSTNRSRTSPGVCPPPTTRQVYWAAHRTSLTVISFAANRRSWWPERLGIPLGTVNPRAHYAVKALRNGMAVRAMPLIDQPEAIASTIFFRSLPTRDCGRGRRKL
jgi:hypothetical protein